jgi:hypothetical protein
MVFSSIFNLYFIDRDMYLTMFTFVIESTLTFKWVVDYARNVEFFLKSYRLEGTLSGTVM